jgi:hypothetical protein
MNKCQNTSGKLENDNVILCQYLEKISSVLEITNEIQSSKNQLLIIYIFGNL